MINIKITGIMILLNIPFIVNAQTEGLKYYENLDLLPYIDYDTELHSESSYDRTGGNDDGFKGTYSALYIDDNGEHVLFDREGPGCVYNLMFTGMIDARLKFYFDGEQIPRLDKPIEKYFSDQNKPFAYPLIYDWYQSTANYNISLPIEFEKHLKITTDNRIGFYSIFSQTYENKEVSSFNPDKSYNSLVDILNKCGTDPKKVPSDTIIKTKIDMDGIARDESLPLLSVQGEGTVMYIKFDPLFPPDPYDLNHIFIRIYYDDNDTPSIYAPVGHFFGSGLGEAAVRSLFIGMSPSSQYYFYLPMPFRKGIKIELVNKKYNTRENPRTVNEFYFEAGVSLKPIRDIDGLHSGYLGAQYNFAYPAYGEQHYEICNINGPGAIVGQVVTIEPVHINVKRWWEGDMMIYIDSEATPRFHGTGHEEDLSLGCWSSTWLLNPFSLPLFGAPKSENLEMVEGQTNGSITTYRFYPGKILFRDAIRIIIEHGTNNNRSVNYSSLVYYYFIPDQ